MKYFLIATICFFYANGTFSQTGPGTWTWVRGDSLAVTESYGVQGIPSPSNNPPSFYEASEWTDTAGNFWLMEENNLWKYEPSIDMWTWMKGPGAPHDTGHYGTYRVPSPQNLPSARAYGCLTWTDLNNNLWLYGGWTTNNICFAKDDLWKYDIATNQWTWMHGTTGCNASTIYGIKGIPSATNRPGGRFETACSWVDNNGDLWMFGGGHAGDVANDIWKYDVITNEWTWMGGDSLLNQLPDYGTMGIAAATNDPGGRCVYSRWKDSNGDFWIMGGNGYDPNTNAAHRADFWKYSHSTGWWTWMGGSNIPYDVSKHYGIQGIASALNYPSVRLENRACWTDSCGNFWMYGGIAFDTNGLYANTGDLWKFDPFAEMWTWVSGDSVFNTRAIRGQQNIASVNNRPGNINGSAPWIDKDGNLWMLGGYGQSNYAGNVLWKYTPDPNNSCSGIESVPKHFSENDLNIFPNPGNGNFQLSMTLSNAQEIEIRVYDNLGRSVFSKKQNANAGSFSTNINLEGFSNGVYLVQVKTAAGNATRRLVVE